MTPERAPQPLGDQVMDFLANLDADRDTKGQSIVRVYDLLEPVSAFTEAAIAEARADERRNTAERIAEAIETAADEHNRRIARIANVPYDPDRRDGMTAGGIRQAARIAREAGGG